jgi:Arc/MetJ-type ribon-helix-helix transcriptional regulator
MAYPFPPDISERVQARVGVGRYQSEDDVLRDAMNALDELEQAKLARWHQRNQIAIEQSRLGLSKPLDLDALLERVEQRVAQNKAIR